MRISKDFCSTVHTPEVIFQAAAIRGESRPTKVEIMLQLHMITANYITITLFPGIEITAQWCPNLGLSCCRA